MEKYRASRRTLLKGAAYCAALLSLPAAVRAQAGLRIRLEWQQFKQTPQYASFVNAIAAMRANHNASDPTSLQYWANVHMNNCPHGMPYFIAWHRGYLYFFEQQLRAVSGDSALNLPYWDYYSYASLPGEFTNNSPGNPLYMPRNSRSVYNALDLAPFDPSVFNFERGRTNAFEPQLESAPHNPVHDLIGGVMTTMQSPLDPIFYLHHANIDRLTHAWALPDGKGIPYTANPYSPATSSPYWSGNHVYNGTAVTLPRYLTCDPTWLGYDYANDNMPTALPPPSSLRVAPTDSALLASGAASLLTGPKPKPAALNPPPEGNFKPTPGRLISAKRRSLGGAASIGLDENSVGASVALPAAEVKALAECLAAAVDANVPGPGVFQSVNITLDGLALRGAGKGGGFFYNFYLNFPKGIDGGPLRRHHFLGTLGAFQLAGMAHQGVQTFTLPATEALIKQALASLAKMTVSCVRVNGDNPPTGEVLSIGELRVEISTDEPWDRSKPFPRPPAPWYS